MIPINYEIKSVFFPFVYGAQHFLAVKNSVEWRGRIVHLILGIAEMLPGVNYIVAIFDRIFHPTWLWDLACSLIPNFEELPAIDQADIKLSDVSVPRLGIREPLSELTPRSCDVLESEPYPWYAYWRQQDTKNWGSLVRSRNIEITSRANRPIMRGQDGEGNAFLIISRPSFRPSKVKSFSGYKVTVAYVGNEVSLIFRDGSYVDICRTDIGDCFSYISRLPEMSSGLIDFIKAQVAN